MSISFVQSIQFLKRQNLFWLLNYNPILDCEVWLKTLWFLKVKKTFIYARLFEYFLYSNILFIILLNAMKGWKDFSSMQNSVWYFLKPIQLSFKRIYLTNIFKTTLILILDLYLCNYVKFCRLFLYHISIEYDLTW